MNAKFDEEIFKFQEDRIEIRVHAIKNIAKEREQKREFDRKREKQVKSSQENNIVEI